MCLLCKARTATSFLFSSTHTLKSFKELGLDSQKIKKLASKLHVHSVNFAVKLVHTTGRNARRALSSTIVKWLLFLD